MRQWLPDVLGLAWVLAAAGAVMAPALVHGSSLGPFDLLSQVGLTKQPGVVVHNQQTGDLIRLFIPWSALAWTQVHHGQLPLWDPYSALGMPLAFNWESAPFSLPALLGYLVPLRYAYTVAVLATLVIAGTGVYVLARLLRLGVIGSVLAATVYELSGQFMANLGWPLSSVMSWAGWLFAAAILVVRGRRPRPRRRPIRGRPDVHGVRRLSRSRDHPWTGPVRVPRRAPGIASVAGWGDRGRSCGPWSIS